MTNKRMLTCFLFLAIPGIILFHYSLFELLVPNIYTDSINFHPVKDGKLGVVYLVHSRTYTCTLHNLISNTTNTESDTIRICYSIFNPKFCSSECEGDATKGLVFFVVGITWSILILCCVCASICNHAQENRVGPNIPNIDTRTPIDDVDASTKSIPIITIMLSKSNPVQLALQTNMANDKNNTIVIIENP